MRKISPTLVVMVAVAGLAMTTGAQAYGYAEAEDPISAIFRDAVAAARGGDMAKASAKAGEALANIRDHRHNGAALGQKISEAAKANNVQALAELMANIVWLATKEKLEANIDDGVKNYKECKARLFLARKNYLDVLDGNIKKNKPEESGRILALFDGAMEAMGNPGLFGVGAKPADPEKFKRSAREIELAVETFYSRFEKK